MKTTLAASLKSEMLTNTLKPALEAAGFEVVGFISSNVIAVLGVTEDGEEFSYEIKVSIPTKDDDPYGKAEAYRLATEEKAAAKAAKAEAAARKKAADAAARAAKKAAKAE